MSNYWKRKLKELEESEKSSTAEKKDRYWFEKQEALKKEEEKKKATSSSDIAPTTNKVVKGEFTGSRERRTWFDTGAFDDGYQFGDVFKTILGTATDIRENLTAGIVGMGEKAVDTAAYLAPFAAKGQFYQNGGAYQSLETQKAFNESIEESRKGMSDFIKKDLYDEEAFAKWIIAGTDEHSVLGEKSDSLLQSAGQLGATIGLQAVGVPWFVTSGVTSFGGQAEAALNEGAGYEEAGLSATISAGAEILSEKLSGGISFGGKTLDDVLLKPLTEKIASKTMKFFTNLGIDAVGEGLEEIFSQTISNIGTALYKEDSIEELLFSEQAMDEYLESFIGGAVLGGVGNVTQAVANRNKVELTEDEQKVFDKVYEDKLAEEDGEVSEKRKNEIRNEVLRMMQRGYISTETIEEVLGGDTYKTYQDTIKNEDALQEEFETLNQMKQSDMTGEQLDRRNELKQQLEDIKQNDLRNQYKTQLGDEVMSLVKGSRLAESYNERYRRGQAYEANLELYPEKQRATIQKAIDSGILNNTNRTHEFVDMVARITAEKGVLFDFTNNERLKNSGFAVDGKTVNGFVNKDGVTLNINSAKALNSVVGHEITHVLEGTKLYYDLQTAVVKYASAKGEYKGRYDALAKLYENVDGADIDKELTADLVGDYLFADKDFVRHLSTANRNVFQKIWDEVKYLCKVATAGSKEARQLEKLKKAFEDAYRESGKQKSGAKYSISDDDILLDDESLDDILGTGWISRIGYTVNETDGKHRYKGDTATKGKVAKLTDERIERLFREYGASNPQYAKAYIATIHPRDFLSLTLSDESLQKWDAAAVDGTNDEVYPLDIDKLRNETQTPYLNIDTVTGEVIGHEGRHRMRALLEAGVTEVPVAIYDSSTKYSKKKEASMRLTSQGYGGDGVNNNFVAEVKNLIPLNAVNRADVMESYGGKGDVKYSISDSDGKQLSDGQQEYFKDSKMRDENGNLMVMYHGTPNKFTTFRQGTAEGWGTGIYFTNNRAEAENYGDNVVEAYLNITNPFNADTMSYYDIGAETTKAYIEYDKELWKNRYSEYETYEEYKADGMGADMNDIYEVDVETFNKILRELGYDGIIADGSNGIDGLEVVAFKENQAKLTTNESPTGDPDIRYSLSAEAEKSYMEAVERGDTETAQQMVLDVGKDAGFTVRAYHGTRRGDRVGNVFLPERATSGPMAFFTDSKEIAEHYARDKADTSLAYDEEYADYYSQFRVNQNGKSIKVQDLWRSMPFSEKQRLKEAGKHITWDDEMENIVWDDNANRGLGNWDAYTLNSHKGNAIEALIDCWLESGELYGNEADFIKVLELAGVNGVEYRDPDARHDKVYDTLLNIQNPFDTANVDESFADGFEEWYSNQPKGKYDRDTASADMWDKNSQTAEKFLARLREDIADGTSYAWTSIPDSVTDYLKFLGHDGIKDTGGKNGGKEHTVWIPFSSEQVKSAEPVTYDDNGNVIPLSGRFNKQEVDIRRSLSEEGEAPIRRGFGTYGEDIALAPVAENTTAESQPIVTASQMFPDDVAPMLEYDEAAQARLASLTDADAPAEDVAPVVEKPVKEAYASIAPKQEKQPRMERATPEEQASAEILVDEPKVEKKKAGVMSKIRNLVLDKGMVFEDLSLKTGNRELQARWDSIRRAEGRAQRFMESGNAMSDSLKSIKDRVEQTGKTKQFYEYLYHLHNTDRMTLENRYEDTENKPVFGYGVTAEMSQEAANKLEKANPEFKQFAQDVYNYMGYLREMLVDGGVISGETAKLWADMYPHYVPIRRVGDEGLNINVPLDTGRTGVNAPVKRATGGNRDILPLFDTMGQRTLQTFKAIAKNRFGVELKNTLGTTIDSDALSLDEAIDSMDAQDLLQEGKNGRSPTFTVFENGEKVTFEITDEMYDAMKPTSDALAYTNKALNTISNVRRGVITEYNPWFLLKNAVKDTQDVLINSQHPVKTYAAIPKAISQMATNGHWYQEYLDNGGDQDTYFDRETNTFTEKNKTVELMKKVTGLDFIAKANNVVERLPRLAEYIASRESGRSVDVSMLDAARVTTNFAAGGDLTKFLNRNGATFLNASVQGAMQNVRNVREAKMNGLKGWASLAGKFVAASLPAVILNNFIWDDDEEYDELSDYVKQNYYIVGKYGDGKFVRIPKGRTVAVIQNAIEQISNAATGDDEVDLNSFVELVITNLAPNNPIDNNILSPIIQVANNETWYGEDLVPTRLADLPAAEQYDETTDSISKWLGETFNISPYKANYLIDQYSGVVGDTILPMLTPEAEGGDDSFLGNMIAPLKEMFTTDSVLKNQNVSDFYDLKDELTVNANASGATDEDMLRSKYMNSVNAELAKLYAQKREIQNSSDLSDGAKYSIVRSIQEQIAELTKEAMNTYTDISYEDDYREGGEYARVGDRLYKVNEDGEWQKLTDEQVTKYEVTKAAGDASYASDGTNHYRWYEPGEDAGEDAEAGWRKVTEKELERQNKVTKGLGISPEAYWNNKEEYSYAYDNPESYAVAKAVGGYDSYRRYSDELYDIKADKDKYGKSISGSRKEKVLDYINNLDADYYTKIILWKSEYPADDTYNSEIVEYLNGRDDITFEETIAILRKLGFKVTDDGNVTW